MLASERREAIANLIASEGRVTVADLVKRFGVTEDCIRKDLRTLAADGRCRRVYGGAIAATPADEHNIISRMAVHAPEKQLMAQKAVRLIEDGQVVFLDISSTNVYLAECIAESGLSCTVISNMLDVLKALTNAPHVKAQCLPGTVDSESGGLLGAQTLAMISDMHFDLAFLGARSASLDADAVTTFEMDDGLVKHMALQNSDVTYVLTETGKYEASGVYVYARLSEFDGAICDDKLSAETRERIEALGLKVI